MVGNSQKLPTPECELLEPAFSVNYGEVFSRQSSEVSDMAQLVIN
jgi:hypothetical protein